MNQDIINWNYKVGLENDKSINLFSFYLFLFAPILFILGFILGNLRFWGTIIAGSIFWFIAWVFYGRYKTAKEELKEFEEFENGR